MGDVNKFLERYPVSSVERLYFEICFDIISQIKIDWEMPEILSLITLFDLRCIELNDGRLIGDNSPMSLTMGSLTDICDVLSVVFSSISDDAIWWKGKYFASQLWNRDTRDRAEARVIGYLLKHGIVKKIYMLFKEDHMQEYSYEFVKYSRK